MHESEIKTFHSIGARIELSTYKLCNIECFETIKLNSTVYGKTFEGKIFRGFSADCESFPLNHFLCIAYDGHGLMHHESFPVNSAFCAQPQKFSSPKWYLTRSHSHVVFPPREFFCVSIQITLIILMSGGE